MRTPLTVLRLDAEGLRSARDRRRIAEGLDRLEDVVTHVIKQSRDSSRHTGGAADGGGCDLGAVVRRRFSFWSILAAEQGRQCSERVPAGRQPIGATPAELELCIDALVNNVFTHTPAGVAFRVEVMAGREAEWALVVHDAGRGLPGNLLPSRGTSGGSGTGLGLDIVRRTAEASGGRMSAGRSPMGGARIEVCFGPPAGRR